MNIHKNSYISVILNPTYLKYFIILFMTFKTVGMENNGENKMS